MDVQEIKKRRFQFLLKLYEISNGNENTEVSIYNIMNDDDGVYIRPPSEFNPEAIVQYLGSEGLVRDMSWYVAKGRTGPDAVSITHKGIKEVEQAIEHPQIPTEHFPANMIYVAGNITNSPIQLGSMGSKQTVTINQNKIDDLEEIIETLKETHDQLALQPQQRNDIRSEIRTIEAQLSSSKPRAKTIAESLSSVKTILEGISATLPIVTKIGMWLQGIP